MSKIHHTINKSVMVLLIVNDLVKKKPPVITGSNMKPRCFKTYKIKSSGSCHYANKKTWIDSELMEEIFKTFNRKCAADDWKILPFIDNASSHPEYFMDCFPHFKIVFLPENTTSKIAAT